MNTQSYWFRVNDRDTHLRQRAMRGDAPSFAELVRPIASVLHGVIQQVQGDAGVALETFRSLVRDAFSEREVRSVAVPVPLWLLKRAVAAAEAGRPARGSIPVPAPEGARDDRTLPDPAVTPPATDFSAGAAPGAAGRSRSVAGALARLPARLRMLLYLRAVPKLRVADLALVFDRPPHQVSATLFHALETVRRSRDRGADLPAFPDAAESTRCTEARESAALLADGDIEEAGIDAHRSHFRTCPACLQCAAARAAVERELAGYYLTEQVPPGMLDAVLGTAVRPATAAGVRFRRPPETVTRNAGAASGPAGGGGGRAAGR